MRSFHEFKQRDLDKLPFASSQISSERRLDIKATILFLGNLSCHYEAMATALEQDGYQLIAPLHLTKTSEVLGKNQVDLVLADVENRGCESVDLLAKLRFSHPNLLRILLVKADFVEGLSEILAHTAAYQYLTKPLQAEQACLVVKRALETRELARRHRLIVREYKIREDFGAPNRKSEPLKKADPSHFGRLVYVSESMDELCRLAREAAPTELPVLIEGETGTGKELLARAVHSHSKRAASPLMVQNCGGLRDELLHSELFGHKRGAFTGAVSDRLGLFRAADGGTVFLDEISEVSASFQVSLLRFLQEGEVKPLGSDKTMLANVRIIAASNRPLKPLVKAGQFREDLYFRLKGFELEIPPLRERRADIPVLTEFFMQKHGSLYGNRRLCVSQDLLEIFKAYPFPGNVRELENEIRRMVALAKDGDFLTSRHVSPALAKRQPPRGPAPGEPERRDKTLKAMVELLEAQAVRKVLEKYHWNQSQAARELGLSRVGLANKIRRYALNEAKADGSHAVPEQGLPIV